MTWPRGRFTLGCVDLVLAMSPTGKCLVVLLFTGVAAPLAGLLFRHVSAGWDSIGKGPLAIERFAPEEAEAGSPRADAELRAEVRQLVVSRNERRLRGGLEPLDVEAETERRLADFIGSS
jgi:hypothetical protein